MGDEIRNCRDVEERLTPYVDGEAAGGTRQAIDAHVSACPPCRRLAESERGGRDLIRDNREGLRVEAPDALRSRCAAHVAAPHVSRLRRWGPLSLAASLLLAAGGAVLFSVSHPIEALAAGFALDHMKCFKIGDTAHEIDADTAAVTWQQRYGWPLVVPASADAESLELVKVRRCLSSDGLAAHLMYRWHGAPVSVYILPRRTAGDEIVDTLGYETAVWNGVDRTYAVVAPGHPDGFAHLVDYMKTHAR